MYGHYMASDVTKLTVNRVPRAVAALDDVALLTGDSKTDSVNRALQVYAFLERQQRTHGKRIFLVSDDNSMERVQLL